MTPESNRTPTPTPAPTPTLMPASAPAAAAAATPSRVHLRDGENGAAIGASFYEQVGGRPFFARLVAEFYRGVATDPVLKPMYPEDDLGPAAARLTGFLEQYWGGPGTYSEQRGHPRLRQRHQPFKVNPDARDRWLLHMRAAVDSLELSALDDATLWDYLDRAAHAMVNTFDA